MPSPSLEETFKKRIGLEPNLIDRELLQGFVSKFGFYSDDILEAYVQKWLPLRDR